MSDEETPLRDFAGGAMVAALGVAMFTYGFGLEPVDAILGIGLGAALVELAHRFHEWRQPPDVLRDHDLESEGEA